MKPLAAIIIAAITATSLAQATLIDFNEFPNGTSASGLYGGILSIQAGTDLALRRCDDQIEHVFFEALISDGKINTLPTPEQAPRGISLGPYTSFLNATFLEPVSSVSFDLFSETYAPVLSYSGTTGQGFSFISKLQLPGPGGYSWPIDTGLSVFLTAPLGGYVTGFTLASTDSNIGNSWIGVDNVDFRRVPEGGSTLWCLAFATGLLMFWRQRGLTA